MLLIPPVLEPLTLAQGKLRAGLDWPEGDPRDVLMEGFIQAARAKVERQTGIALLTQTHQVPIEATGCRFELPYRPVQSVVIEAVDPDTGVVTPWSAIPYATEAGSVDPRPAKLTSSRYHWPSGLRATIVCGFTSVELLQAAAPDLVHAVGLLTSHYATVGRDLATVGTIIAPTPEGYEALLAPYELVVVA